MYLNNKCKEKSKVIHVPTWIVVFWTLKAFRSCGKNKVRNIFFFYSDIMTAVMVNQRIIEIPCANCHGCFSQSKLLPKIVVFYMLPIMYYLEKCISQSELQTVNINETINITRHFGFLAYSYQSNVNPLNTSFGMRSISHHTWNCIKTPRCY